MKSFKKIVISVLSIFGIIGSIFFVQKSQFVPRVLNPGVSGMNATNADALTMSQYTRLVTNSDSEGILVTSSNIITINGVDYNNIPNHIVSADEQIMISKVRYIPKFKLVGRFIADIVTKKTISASDRSGGVLTIVAPSSGGMTFTEVDVDDNIVTNLSKSSMSFYDTTIDAITIESTNEGNFIVFATRRVSEPDYLIPASAEDEIGIDFLNNRYIFTITLSNISGQKEYVYGEIYYVE